MLDSDSDEEEEEEEEEDEEVEKKEDVEKCRIDDSTFPLVR